jgi:hypothetical protein
MLTFTTIIFMIGCTKPCDKLFTLDSVHSFAALPSSRPKETKPYVFNAHHVVFNIDKD